MSGHLTNYIRVGDFEISIADECAAGEVARRYRVDGHQFVLPRFRISDDDVACDAGQLENLLDGDVVFLCSAVGK